jgi:hypothetical protein
MHQMDATYDNVHTIVEDDPGSDINSGFQNEDDVMNYIYYLE